jgi:hypothetical protein
MDSVGNALRTGCEAMIGSLWNKLIKFHRSRLIYALLDHSKEDYQRNFDTQFSSAKMLSDFVGMIVRFAFVMFAAQYFLKVAPQEEWLISKYALGLCGTFALGLMFVLGGRIMLIILMYEARDLHVHRARWVRVIFLCISMIVTATLYYGMYTLAKSLVAMKSL